MKLKTARRFLRRNRWRAAATRLGVFFPSPSWERRIIIAGRVVKEAKVKK